ncbi:myo-inosose-2 dehydratase [Mesorhizobium sp. B3-1-9]|uniref:myo-inosose-2 dehydratase n=1 Tax=unclassified Mesorhizobium TaxID=325217 RepID=UPI0011269D00|nr:MULTISPECIES: myo-inosose-2 dehydratase [unclassified Mesorhizobium]TPI35900.1 myo-inosose-2 dehydratase [Mesorhizobium sp. B3-1-9]TPJ35195.1 myo-inosose-2 dehydratase [Mesorhizobium sp. B2-8-3]
MTTVRLGINPITWTNDDVPELGGDTPLETCLSETAEAGYAGTELGGKFPRDSRALRPILDHYGLALVSGWYDGRICEKDVDEEFEAIRPHLTLLRDLGARRVVYADTSHGRHGAIHDPISQRPKLMDGEWKAYGAKITRLAERFSDFGVGMAFHHHMGTIVETDAEIDRLMHTSGEAVGLLYDTGHCAFSGGDPEQLLRRHVERVVHVHCKDVRPAALKKARDADMSFMGAVMEGIFTVPGDGAIDYPTLLKILADQGYSGWLVVEAEQDPAKAHPLTYATMGYRNLKRLAQGAGFYVHERAQEVRHAG